MSAARTEHVVRLDFPAKPDYLLLARLALAGIARALPLDEEAVADLKLAVTEACGNAVRHAYEDDEGIVAVSYVIGPTTLELIVEDRGTGISEDDDLSGEIVVAADTLGGVQVDGAGEDRHAFPQKPLVLRAQVVTPVQGCPQRLMAGGSGTVAQAEKPVVVVQTNQQFAG